MDAHYIVIGIAVVVILAFQVLSLIGTVKRMYGFGKIFGGKDRYIYEVDRDDNGKVNGFLAYDRIEEDANGGAIGYFVQNPYFLTIQDSINGYISNNDVVDFQLVKDTIDGNCDALEEDIQTQIPIPLYLGLAGTMFGIIFGVGYLWFSGSLDSLLSITPGTTGQTEGIVVLLGGVAVAMTCSIIGLLFTTICTYLFKGYRLTNEQRKNEFLAWLQQNLLSQVATTDVEAMNQIASKLNDFNVNFKKQSDAFAASMLNIGKIVNQQNELALVVGKMGEQAKEMADNNALASQKLSKSADKIMAFNDYLDKIDTLINRADSFVDKFQAEENRLEALEEIREFFYNEKTEISKRNDSMRSQVGKIDDGLRTALKELREHVKAEKDSLNILMSESTDDFKKILEYQKKMFNEANKEIVRSIKDEFDKLPKAMSAIGTLEGFPKQMESLLNDLKKSNNDLAKELRKQGGQGSVVRGDAGVSSSFAPNNSTASLKFPSWLKYSILVALVIITLSCVFNSYNTWKMSVAAAPDVEHPTMLIQSICCFAVVVIAVSCGFVAFNAWKGNRKPDVNDDLEDDVKENKKNASVKSESSSKGSKEDKEKEEEKVSEKSKKEDESSASNSEQPTEKE